MKIIQFSIAAILSVGMSCSAAGTENVTTTKTHGLSLAGPLKYGPDFTHLDYVNPQAPKGGRLKMAAMGGFDNLNPYIPKGQAASGLGLTFETLMTGAADDMSAEYGLVASSVEVPEDLSWVVYDIRPQARFHDGTKITADDLIFSLETLKKSGRPLYRYYYANVSKAEKLSDLRIKFHFSGPPNRELPQIVGQLPILSKKHFQTRKFDETTLTPILGSGPYKVKRFEANRFVEFERAKDYWGKDLPINKGRYNFDEIRYDFYRDNSVLLEAFKAGEYDYRSENSAKNWATGYKFPAAAKGLVKTDALPHGRSSGMQGYAYNLRRSKFHDPVLREALGYAFDFEWTNRNIFYDQYKRTESYFSNSVMAARGKPSAAELKILEPYRDQLPPRVFGDAFKAPVSDGSGRDRKPLRRAKTMLKQAGWKVKAGKLIDPKSGQALTIEFLMFDQNSLRIVSPIIKNLKRLGVTATSRIVDSAQYTERLRNYDFDVITAGFGQSLSPGNEQREFWGSEAGKRGGSRNVIGIDNPVVDALIENLIAAPDYDSLTHAVRALDRVLTWNFYVIPQFHASYDRIAYWNKFGRSPINPASGPAIMSWWYDKDRDAALKQGLEQLKEK